MIPKRHNYGTELADSLVSQGFQVTHRMLHAPRISDPEEAHEPRPGHDRI